MKRQQSFNFRCSTIYQIKDSQIMVWINSDDLNKKDLERPKYLPCLDVENKTFGADCCTIFARYFLHYLHKKNPQKYFVNTAFEDDFRKLGNFIMLTLLDNGFKPV